MQHSWVNVCQLSPALSAAAVTEQQISKSAMMHIPGRAGIKYFITSDTETSPNLVSFSRGHILSDGPALGEGRGCLGLRCPGADIAGSKVPAARASQAAVPVLAHLKISRNSRKNRKLLFFCNGPGKTVESLLYRPGTSGLVPSWGCLWDTLSTQHHGLSTCHTWWLTPRGQHCRKHQLWLQLGKCACFMVFPKGWVIELGR